MISAQPLRVMLIAGEPSGDVLGAGLLNSLQALSDRPIEVIGVGGSEMMACGLDSLFPMSDLSVMGLSEVVPRLPTIQAHISQAVGLALRSQPDVLVTIDSPDFTFRVARQIRKCAPTIPIVHLVAPQVWAWRRGRARKLAGLIDHLLVLLPFEQEIFTAAGVPCTFIGHPVVERAAPAESGETFRRTHNIAESAPLLGVLPGSRHSEVSRLLPVFAEVLQRLVLDYPNLSIFCATVGPVAEMVRAAAAGWPVPAIFTESSDEKMAGFAACDAAMAASGTVSLELAVTGTPHVIGYRLNPLTAFIARRVLQVAHVNLINLILGQAVIPELLAEACTPEALAGEVSMLLAPGSAAAAHQRLQMAQAVARLAADEGESPSLVAARTVLRLLSGKQ